MATAFGQITKFEEKVEDWVQCTEHLTANEIEDDVGQ